jgi:predicted nucleic acid-binding Zn ribbon protein
MPVYQFHCKQCDWRLDVVCSIDTYTSLGYSNRASEKRSCAKCGAQTARVFNFSVKTMVPEHFNRSAGEYVTGERQLRDAFKRQSEAATIRTGIEHNFVPIDLADKKALGVTDEGLSETYDRRTKLGMRVPDVIRPENMG